MYWSDEGECYRYQYQVDDHVNIAVKLSLKTLHSRISKLLGLLFEPNETSISKFSVKSDKVPVTIGSIYERLWEQTN
jgi:hypothetical protein